jgi:predicted MPP superfamily phosphohydrolase
MKLITIGDLHGSPVWKQINLGDWNHLIFIGDYVDSDNYTEKEIIDNIHAVIELKKNYPEKVVLLWGNHDLAYLYGGQEKHYCSGFRKAMLPELFSIFTSNRKLFQASFQVSNYLWTHAGVVQLWFDTYIKDEVVKNDINLSATLNRLFESYYEPLFHVSMIRGGLYEDGGIFWAHSTETFEDPLIGFHQMVGHSNTHEGVVVADHYGNNTSVTYTDCLKNIMEFFNLEIGN